MKMFRLMRRRRGFTLIELMVAIVIAGIVVVSAYALFSNTSRAMYEVDNLSKLNDQARFAAELIARDVRSAGSLSTPNSYTDKFVNPSTNLSDNPLKNSNFVRAIYMPPLQDVAIGPQGQAVNGVLANAGTSSDQLIVMGAYDYPFTFEISGLEEATNGEVTSAIVREGPRGTWRFARRDPFDVRVDTLGSLSAGQLQSLSSGTKARLMRAIDRNGYMMFATIDPATDGFEYNANEFAIKFSDTQRFRFRVGNEQNGFEPAASEDEGYEAALLDAFRYRVCISREDVNNLQLVRERVDPSDLIDDPSSIVTNPSCGDLPSGVLEQHVVAEHVADFQVWFDCTPNNSLALEEVVRQRGWLTPDAAGANVAHNCLNTDSLSASTFGRADQVRVAHIRLSLHTPTERSDLPNYRFLTNQNPLTTTTDPSDAQAVEIGRASCRERV